MSEEYHIPVMVREVMDYLQVSPGGLFMDCTLGGGGHTAEMLARGGRVIGIDRDPEAVRFANERLSEYQDSFTAVVSEFSRIREVAGRNAGAVDGIVMDLGVSSRMIDDPSRGFSYRHEGPLLMTMGESGVTAADIVNSWRATELAALFRDYGEERNSSKIAKAIVEERSRRPIQSTGDLADVIEKTVGPRLPQKSKARIFQALRIAVNREVEELETGLDGAMDVLKSGGRLCVISYHSVEDRIVKSFMKDRANPCICPPSLPICRCGKTPSLKLITGKPVKPQEAEMAVNSRAHSALLRVGEKL